MAAGMIIVRIDGLDELRAKLTSTRAEPPVQRFLDRAAIFIQGQARIHAPVDTNVLRGSVTVETTGKHERSIGTNKDYGPYVEFGTRPHFPPVAAITPWAKRHRLEPFAVARAIGMRGTKAQPFMRPAAVAGEAMVKTLVPILAAEIEAAYS